jgi:hypothetical protein
MQHPQASPTPNHVRAVFVATAAFFDLPRIATFADLADRLCNLGERHPGPLTSVEVVTDPAVHGVHVRAALIRQLTTMNDEALPAE